MDPAPPGSCRGAQGGAWWQWRQPCGDPHSLHREGDEWVPGDTVVHLHTMDCVADAEVGPTEELLTLLSRGYPRATPGRIDLLHSDPHTGHLLLEARAAEAGTRVVVWTPTADETHAAWADNLDELAEHPVAGGRLLTGTVAADGAYALGVDPR